MHQLATSKQKWKLEFNVQEKVESADVESRQLAGDGYWSLVEPVWLPLNRSWDEGSEEFVRLFRAIRPEIGNLYAGHWCQSEVRNGGFHQFFSNTTGLLAPEALAGFRAVGLAELAEILAAAMDFFGSRTLRPPWRPSRSSASSSKASA